MTKAISTTTTKHPHLSIVQLFKEPPHRVQQRSEIMNSSLAAVKHFVSPFNRRPGTTPEQRPQNTRLASTSTTTPAFTENRRSAEEGRIIEIQLPASTQRNNKSAYGGIADVSSHRQTSGPPQDCDGLNCHLGEQTDHGDGNICD